MSVLTLAEYKAVKRRTKTDEDVQLQQTINTVNDMIESYLNRDSLEEAPRAHYVSLNYETEVVWLKYWPIKSIETIVALDAGEAFSTQDNTYVLDTDYYLEEDRILKVSGNWPSFPQRLYLEYTAGYTTIPEGLKKAAVELVDFYEKERFLQSRVAGNTTITNLVSDIAIIPAHIRTILNGYK